MITVRLILRHHDTTSLELRVSILSCIPIWTEDQIHHKIREVHSITTPMAPSNYNSSSLLLLRLHQLKNPQIQRNPLAQPSRPLRMIPFLLLIHGIRMHQRTQRTAVDNQPRNKGAELSWRKQIHLKHGHRVWTDGFVEEGVDAEFGDCRFFLACKILRLVGGNGMSS